MAEEWVDHAHSKLKDKEARRVSAAKALAIVEKKIKDFGIKLTDADRERKNPKAALAGTEKQVEDQYQHLRKTEQLTIAREQIEAQKKDCGKKRKLSLRPRNLAMTLE